MTRAINARVTALEHATGMAEGPLPTIFIFVTDASRPDPENPTPATDYSEHAIIGAYTSPRDKGRVIERKPGEKMEAFKKRLSKTLPDQRVFFMRYRHEAGIAHTLTTP